MSESEKYEENIDMGQIADLAIDVVQPNKIFRGEIVTIDDDFAYVNVGIKTDGRISLEEFETNPEIGDIVEVSLVNKRMIDGMYVFSKRRAEKERRWMKFIELYNNGDGSKNILGIVKGKNSKGINVDCDGVDAFLPFSHAGDIRAKRDAEAKLSYWFTLRSIDDKRRTIILSRKEYLEEEKRRCWMNLLSKYGVGDRIKGKVIKIGEFGAFIEIEGIEGFLHRNDISWRKIFKPQSLLKVGEERDFVILNISREEEKVSLGLKQLQGDPWLSIDEKYSVGDIVTGSIVSFIKTGAFSEIEEGIDGYIDSSDISWTKKNMNIKDVFRKGQKIEAKILDINKEEKRLSLGYKQIYPNPWDTIDGRIKVGSIHKSRIKNIVNFGIFVELEDDIDGLIHISDISWDVNIKDPLSQYTVGSEVEFEILEIKKDEMKIACGIKQLSKSPWEIIKEKYPHGSRVLGVISGVVPFGLFVKIGEEVEGLVHISEVSQNRIERLDEQFKIGDEVNAIVLGVDVGRRRLSLSIKDYDIIRDKEELERILNDTSPKKVTIGDIIKVKLGE